MLENILSGVGVGGSIVVAVLRGGSVGEVQLVVVVVVKVLKVGKLLVLLVQQWVVSLLV